MLPVVAVLVIAVLMLYRHSLRLSKAEANLRISRDRANLDLQMIVHQSRVMQEHQRQPTDALSDCSQPGQRSSQLVAPPYSLPPGPPSSSGPSAAEHEVAHVLLSCAGGQANHQTGQANHQNGQGAGVAAEAVGSGVAALATVPSAAPIPCAVPNQQWHAQSMAGVACGGVAAMATAPSGCGKSWLGFGEALSAAPIPVVAVAPNHQWRALSAGVFGCHDNQCAGVAAMATSCSHPSAARILAPSHGQWHGHSVTCGGVAAASSVPSAAPNGYQYQGYAQSAGMACGDAAPISCAAPLPCAPIASTAAAASYDPTRSLGGCCTSQSTNTTKPTPEQALQLARHSILVAQTQIEVHRVVRTLGMALGATRMESGTIKALHAVLLQLARPGMSDVEAYTATGASRSNFTKWRRRVQNVQLDYGHHNTSPHPASATALPPQAAPMAAPLVAQIATSARVPTSDTRGVWL